MNSIKEKFTLFIAKKKYFSKKQSATKFNESISSATRFLVILPESSDETLAAVDVPSYFQINKKEVVLLGHKKILPIALEIRNFKSIPFSEEDLTRLGLPNQELTAKIKKENFDVVIDLSRGDNLLYSILANIPKSAIKIGFKKERSDEFYNLQVANNQNNAEISYRNFLNSIQMF